METAQKQGEAAIPEPSEEESKEESMQLNKPETQKMQGEVEHPGAEGEKGRTDPDWMTNLAQGKPPRWDETATEIHSTPREDKG